MVGRAPNNITVASRVCNVNSSLSNWSDSMNLACIPRSINKIISWKILYVENQKKFGIFSFICVGSSTIK